METKVRKLSHLSNFIFFASVIFCLAFLWCNYYIKNIKVSLISSIIITISILIISISIKQIKSKNLHLKKSNEQALENFKLNLQYCKNSEILNIVCCPQISNNLHKKSPYHYHTNTFDIFIFINTDDICKAYNERITNNVIIATNQNIDIPVHSESLQIKIISDKDLFILAKEKNFKFQNQFNNKKTNKYSLKDILCILLCKAKSKSYFGFALLLLFGSLFTPFSTYYIVFSSVFFALSLFCRFNKYFNKNPN